MPEPVLDPRLESDKKRAAAISLLYNLVLTVLKSVAAGLTGSVSLFSESVHSASDVIASFVSYLAVRASSAPPDEEHQYGHGKIESLTGLAEAVLLMLTVAYILFEAVERLFHGHKLDHLDIGLAVMGLSSLSSVLVGTYVQRVGKRSNSIALQSNGQHLMVDFWTSVGVLAALATTKLTGWEQADSWFAIALGIWITYGAWSISRRAVDVLIDRKMGDAEIAQIQTILRDQAGCLSYHQLRTRTSGNMNYIEVHIVVPNTWSVVEAHDLADNLEKQIQGKLNPAYVVIHVDPYDDAKIANLQT